MASVESSSHSEDDRGATPSHNAKKLQEVTRQLAQIARVLSALQSAAAEGKERRRRASVAEADGHTQQEGTGQSDADGQGATAPAGAASSAGATGVRRRRGAVGDDKDGQGSSSSPAARPGDGKEEVGEDVCRPSLYPHAPKKQLDSLESNKFEEIELLDALKLQSFEGFYNLSFIVLLFALSYISMRNIKQHGFFLMKSSTHLLCPAAFRDMSWVAIWVCLSLIAVCAIFFVQKLFSVGSRIRPNALFGAYGAIQLIVLCSTTLFIYVTPISPPAAAMLLMWVVVVMMKLHSYVATNYSMHQEWTRNGRKAVSENAYPRNVRFRNLAYFIAAPTLVYEAQYSRSERIRKSYVLKKSLQGIGCSLLQYVLMAQFILPVLRAEEGRASGSLVLDLMKLAVPSFAMWLAGFYMIFHCLLNVVAELLRFSDRKFFEDWWNATSLDAFWRKWNIPVHEWCLRHVFIESQHYYRASKGVATFATFFMSAILHEVLFSVAFKTVKPWFFIGMLAQIPMIMVTRFFRGKRRGNFLVWLSLFMSQPLLEILYFRAWYQDNDNFFCVTETHSLLTSMLDW